MFLDLAITFFPQRIESGPHWLLNEIRLVLIGHWVHVPYIFGHPPLLFKSDTPKLFQFTAHLVLMFFLSLVEICRVPLSN